MFKKFFMIACAKSCVVDLALLNLAIVFAIQEPGPNDRRVVISVLTLAISRVENSSGKYFERYFRGIPVTKRNLVSDDIRSFCYLYTIEYPGSQPDRLSRKILFLKEVQLCKCFDFI